MAHPSDSHRSKNLQGNASLAVTKSQGQGYLKSIRKCSADARFREPKLMHGRASRIAHSYTPTIKTIGLGIIQRVIYRPNIPEKSKISGAIAAIGRQHPSIRIPN